MLELVLELHVGISWRQACKNIKSVIQLVVGNAIQALGSVYVMLILLFSLVKCFRSVTSVFLPYMGQLAKRQSCK